MLGWWNWQTRTFEGRMPQGVGVQVPSRVPQPKQKGGRISKQLRNAPAVTFLPCSAEWRGERIGVPCRASRFTAKAELIAASPHFSYTVRRARQRVAARPERKVARALARKHRGIGLKPKLPFALPPFAPAGCEKCRLPATVRGHERRDGLTFFTPSGKIPLVWKCAALRGLHLLQPAIAAIEPFARSIRLFQK